MRIYKMIETNSILDKANELKAKQKPFALVTVVRCESPTSAKPGAKAIVYENGSIQGWIGGGCAQPAVIDTVKKALKDGQPRLIRVSPAKEGSLDDGIIYFKTTALNIFRQVLKKWDQITVTVLPRSFYRNRICILFVTN